MKAALLLAVALAGCAQTGFGPSEQLQTQINPDSVAALAVVPAKTLMPVNAKGKVQLEDRTGFKDDSVIRVRLYPVIKSLDFDPIRKSDRLTALTLKNEKGLVAVEKGSQLFKAARPPTSLRINFEKKTMTAEKETVTFTDDVEIRPADASVTTEIDLPTDHARLVRSGFLEEGHHPAFRGTFNVTTTHDETSSDAKTRASLVNFVPFESYLDSVVPSEVIADVAPREALKAQAIAARTFALRSLITSRCVGKTGDCADRGWDVDPSTSYQSYVGATAEREKVTAALNEVRHQIVTYDNGPILAMFYASSGGRTSAAKQTICRPVAHARGKQRCLSRIDQNYPYFTAKQDPYNGRAHRFGHGLGLPQVSARNMAEKGFSATQILGQYYVGTEIRELTSLKP